MDGRTRTSGGAEIDLLLSFPDSRLWAVEIKRTLSPRPDRGFHAACADLDPTRRFVIYPGDETYPLGNDIQAVPLPALARLLAGAGKTRAVAGWLQPHTEVAPLLTLDRGMRRAALKLGVGVLEV